MEESWIYLEAIASKIMEFILIAFFWLFDKFSNFLIDSGLVESQTTANLVSIIVVGGFYVVLLGIFLGPVRNVGGGVGDGDGGGGGGE
ncbi:hypothetical protein F9U64_11195 [Gracilibacillus oryzae]|uniref:Uncharacterized protein n=1 Tax=Gracilibacillus oryzae TaxID=1672701 RepID=A0A7C8KY15_9BACI|nr:hypothetical protein [Gracilibacillus oryzae]KAB8134699.1 hypothetical protein F9U64_11195 [Gracilibacillus oryzae]